MYIYIYIYILYIYYKYIHIAFNMCIYYIYTYIYIYISYIYVCIKLPKENSYKILENVFDLTKSVGPFALEIFKYLCFLFLIF